MSHLSPSEFVDLAEGALRPDRAAHASTCEACQAQATVVRDALQMVAASSGIPEPSPLFWDHLSARVRDAIASTPRHSTWGFGWRGFQPLAVVLALAVAVGSVALLTRDARRDATPLVVGTTPGPVSGDPDQEPDPTLDPSHAEVWAVLTAAAADLQLDEAQAAGMAVRTSAIDRAVQGLTAAERTELGRLLQSELKRSGN